MTSQRTKGACRLRIGIVGCGEVAQAMHLPSLRRLARAFDVVALADPSATVLTRIGEQWGVPPPRCFQEWRQLVTCEDLDVVLVACPPAYHAEVALAAIAAGLHVFVEKPMCLNEDEARELVAAQERTGLVVQIGYMRRYAAAFLEGCRLVSEMPQIHLARVRNVLGLNELIGDQATEFVRPDDLVQERLDSAARDQTHGLRGALGADADTEALHTYFFLLSLCTHDFSAMRDLIGAPRGVLYATRRNGDVSPFLTMAFDYGTFVCHYEAGFDELPRVEQDMQVYGNDRVVSVAYGSTFVRNNPVVLRVTSAVGRLGTETRVVTPSFEDPFVSEWLAFHASVVEGAPVRASPQDALLDIQLCRTVADQITRTRTLP